MSEQHDVESLGSDLDRTLRTALMVGAQIAERAARRAGIRDGQEAQRLREEARNLRAGFLDARDAARAHFVPHSRPGAVSRDPASVSARAWAVAQEWAPVDPLAASVARDLWDQFTERHGTTPETFLEGLRQDRAQPDPGRTGEAELVDVAGAAELARQHAPFYYRRHDGIVAETGAAPVTPAQGALVQDWQAWVRDGHLPQESLMREWANWSGHGDEISEEAFRGEDGMVNLAARDARIAQVWAEGAEQRTALAYSQHLSELGQSGTSAEEAVRSGDAPAPASREELVGTVESASARSSAMLQDGAFAQASQADAMQAWLAAAVYADQDPDAKAAADRLDRLYQDRFGISPNAQMEAELSAALDAAADVDQSGASAVAGTTPEGQVVLPAGRGHFDRGMSPSKASTTEEAAHRRQSWEAAREAHAATLPQGLTEAQRTAAWEQLPKEEQWEAFWGAYDTLEARTVPSQDPEGFTAEHDGVMTPEQAAQVAEIGERSTVAGAAEPASSQENVAGAAGAIATSAEQEPDHEPTPVPAGRDNPDRGVAPSKANSPEERRHRTRAWAMAREQHASSGSSQPWQKVPQNERYRLYWSVYDSAQARGVQPPPETPTARGEAATPAAEVANSPAPPAQEATTSRERIVELTQQAGEFYGAQYPGSPAQEHLHRRFGPEVDQAGYQVGYAPSGWRQLTDHLRARGATDQELVDAGLAARTRNGDRIYDRFRDRAVLGVHDDQGQLVGFTGRDLSDGNPEETPKYINTAATAAFRKGELLFGDHEAPAGARVVRVEGALDAVAVTMAGEGKVYGVSPMGTALTPEQAEQLAARSSDGVVLEALDRDTGGSQARARDQELIAEHGLSMRTVVFAASDPAEQWEQDPEGLRAALGVPATAMASSSMVRLHEISATEGPVTSGTEQADRVESYAQIVAAAPRQDQPDLVEAAANTLSAESHGKHAVSVAGARQLIGEVGLQALPEDRWAPGTSWARLADDLHWVSPGEAPWTGRGPREERRETSRDAINDAFAAEAEADTLAADARDGRDRATGLFGEAEQARDEGSWSTGPGEREPSKHAGSLEADADRAWNAAGQDQAEADALYDRASEVDLDSLDDEVRVARIDSAGAFAAPTQVTVHNARRRPGVNSRKPAARQVNYQRRSPGVDREQTR